MRQKRAKTYKKLMELYSRSFGFRQPYQVLVDSTFAVYAVQNKIDIPKQLGTVLQGQQKQMITQCSMVELYKLGPSHQHIVDTAKTFERRKCNHKEAIPTDECIKSVVGETNKHRYVVATQSQELRNLLRSIPSVPIIHVNRVVMVLEPPSDATLRAKALSESQAQTARPTELAAIAATTPAADAEPPRKKRKGPKEPNPLSVKKKQPKTVAPPRQAGPSKLSSRSRPDRPDGDVSNGISSGKKRKRHTLEGSDGQGEPSSIVVPTRAGPAVREEQRAEISTREPVPTQIIAIADGVASESVRGRKKKRRRKGTSEAQRHGGDDGAESDV